MMYVYCLTMFLLPVVIGLLILVPTLSMSNNHHMDNYHQNISRANTDGLHGVTSGYMVSNNVQIPISHSNIMHMSDNVYIREKISNNDLYIRNNNNKFDHTLHSNVLHENLSYANKNNSSPLQPKSRNCLHNNVVNNPASHMLHQSISHSHIVPASF